MIINKFNIEKWMFDYFEDNLTMHERIEFERFLLANPHFQEELDLWDDSYNSATDFPAYEVPNSLLKESFFNNSKVLVSIGLLFLMVSSLGVYSYINSIGQKEMDSELVFSTQDSINQENNTENLTKPKTSYLYNDESNSLESKSNELLKSSKNKIDNKFLPNKISGLNKRSKIKFKNSKEALVESFDLYVNERVQKSTTEKINETESGLITLATNNKRKLDVQLKSNEMKEILVPEIEKNIVTILKEKEKSNSKYKYLDFKRNKKRKPLSLNENKRKQREKNFWDNLALIGNVFLDKDGKIKKNKKSKFLSQFKNKELALTNTHDPIFIKTNSNPIENNLALVGGLEMTRFKANLSNRWMKSVNEQNIGSLTVDTYLDKLNAGVGINANTTMMNKGLLKTSSFGVTYSQRIQLKESVSINIGIKYDYNMTENNNLNSDNFLPLEFKQNQLMSFSNSLHQKNKSVSHNFSSAVWYDGQFLYGGINLDNIKSIKKQNNYANEFAEYINPFKFAIQLGTDYRRNVYSALIISPQVNYSYELNRSELWLGSSLKYKRFVTGIGATLSHSYKANIGIQGDKVRLIYAFDVSKSAAESKYYGTHEISFRYLLRSKNNWNK